MNKHKLKKIMGKNVRDLRESRDISIEELAELLSLTPGFVGLLERGERGLTAYNIMQISNIFNISPDIIFKCDSFEDGSLSEPNERKLALEKVVILTKNLSKKELDFLNLIIPNLKNLH